MSRFASFVRVARAVVADLGPTAIRGRIQSVTANGGQNAKGKASSARSRSAVLADAKPIGSRLMSGVSSLEAAASRRISASNIARASLTAAVRLLGSAPASSSSTACALEEGEDDDDTTTTGTSLKKRRIRRPPSALIPRTSTPRPWSAAGGGRWFSGGAEGWRGMTHLREGTGEAHMVDISGKAASVREAIARAEVKLPLKALDALEGAEVSRKGDAAAVVRIAAIQGAKRCAELIPLAHPVALASVTADVAISRERGAAAVTCTARCEGRTGVEMEALMGASVGALALYGERDASGVEGHVGRGSPWLPETAGARQCIRDWEGLGTEYVATCAADMLKSVDKGIEIGPVRLLVKTGGKSGVWHHSMGRVSEQEYEKMRQAAGGRHPGTGWA